MADKVYLDAEGVKRYVEAFVISGTHQARGLGPGAAREGYRGDPLCNWAGRPD